MKIWRRWTHRTSTQKKDSNAKEVLTPQRSGNFIFPVADETVKICGEEQHLRTFTLNRERPERGEQQEINHLSSSGGPRVQLYMPKEESFPIPVKYIDVTRTTHTSLDVLLEKILKITGTWMEKENYRTHGQGITRFILLNERPPDGYTWSGGETHEETNDFKTRQCTARYVEAYAWMHRKRKQSKNGPSRNQSSIMPDNCGRSSSLNQMTKNLNIS